MRAVITGASGFVGRNMHRLLQEAGWEVLPVDVATGWDCRDFFHRFKHAPYDLLVHCAAVVGGRTFIEGKPLELAAADLEIDAAMFGFLQQGWVRKTVYFSSSAAYPVKLQRTSIRLCESDINLDDVRSPDFTYGWVKLTGEQLARHAVAQGHDILVVRPFSGYGPDQSLDYPFPRFLHRVRRQERSFQIWGDGNQVRDFIHIEDVCRAVLQAIHTDIRGPVNLCTGEATSFNQLAQCFFDVAGWEPDGIVHRTDKPVGVKYRVGDPRRMRNFYTPRISLRDGIEAALNG